jgi:hypothetical protein
MGDFNLHAPGETQALSDAGLVDAWREVHGADEGSEKQGVSWEGSRCWWLPFDNRTMRLGECVFRRGGVWCWYIPTLP